MFFLMLLAGNTIEPHRVLKHSTRALTVSIGGMLVPLGLSLALECPFLPEGELHTALCLS
jgi:Kef-type K+ transport system membrane component KefB